MAQQTAVEWLIEQLDEQVYRIDHKDNRINISISFEDLMSIKKQAKQMEKEQIINAWEKAYSIGCVNGGNDYVTEKESDTGINYYNETYNK